MTDVANPPLWESQVLQWLSDMVARERQKEKSNTSQHQYDVSLVAKITSLCNQLSTGISTMIKYFYFNILWHASACTVLFCSYMGIIVINLLMWFFIITVAITVAYYVVTIVIKHFSFHHS